MREHAPLKDYYSSSRARRSTFTQYRTPTRYVTAGDLGEKAPRRRSGSAYADSKLEAETLAERYAPPRASSRHTSADDGLRALCPILDGRHPTSAENLEGHPRRRRRRSLQSSVRGRRGHRHAPGRDGARGGRRDPSCFRAGASDLEGVFRAIRADGRRFHTALSPRPFFYYRKQAERHPLAHQRSESILQREDRRNER